jgi:hypothetical protein
MLHWHLANAGTLHWHRQRTACRLIEGVDACQCLALLDACHVKARQRLRLTKAGHAIGDGAGFDLGAEGHHQRNAALGTVRTDVCQHVRW